MRWSTTIAMCLAASGCALDPASELDIGEQQPDEVGPFLGKGLYHHALERPSPLLDPLRTEWRTVVGPSDDAANWRIPFRGWLDASVDVTVSTISGNPFNQVCFVDGITGWCSDQDPTTGTVVQRRGDRDEGRGFDEIMITSRANLAARKLVDTAASSAEVVIVETRDRLSHPFGLEVDGWELSWMLAQARHAGDLYPTSSTRESRIYSDLRADLHASPYQRPELAAGERFLAYDLPALDVYSQMTLWIDKPDGGRLTVCLIGGESEGRRFGRCLDDWQELDPSTDGRTKMLLNIPRADAAWWNAADYLVVSEEPFWRYPNAAGASAPVRFIVQGTYYGM